LSSIPNLVILSEAKDLLLVFAGHATESRSLNAMESAITFSDDSLNPAVRGFIHSPENPNGDALILTHGAGSNCTAPLLVAISETLAGHGYIVLRCDLPFRQERRTGPPFPGNAERDRAGLRNAVAVLRKNVAGRIFLGGHSYGGRQATMLCAAEPDLVSGLLLLSYPLHPPRKPEQLRIQHLPNLRTPSLFLHGSRDPFGSLEEMAKALQVIPAKTELMKVEGAGHDLGFNGNSRVQELPARILAAFENHRI
jgi:predicted alpha/beta-hydrolase family hydrolase